MTNENQLILDCECCGGRLLEVNTNTFKCDHCGYTKIIQTNFTTEIVSMINQANILRNKGEFDDAGDIFREVILKDETNPEGYWGLFLCDYGIMHVKDPVSKKYIPTCNRASSIPVDEDENYNKSLNYASDIKKEDLKSKGEILETIRQKIIDLSSNEDPYDIFICYKRTQRIVDGKESYTEDAINARDIYDMLSTEGYKVFFAEKTLQHLAGAEYEPLIYNALNTSKVMLVVCSDPTFINSPWVKNEWRRYLKQMEFDESKKILPIMCGGMKANRLPDLLKKFQGLEMNVNIKEHLLDSVANHLSKVRSNIQKINIGGMKTAKKSSVIKQNVAVRKIGEDGANEVRLSDANRIKLAYNYISKEMYNDAEREFSILSSNRELIKLIKFGQDYINFKKRIVNEFDIDEFNSCIESANSQIANVIFTLMKEDFIENIKLCNDRRSSFIYSAIMKWEFEGSDEVFRVANNFVKSNPSGKSWFVFNAIANCFDSQKVDEYISTMNTFAECFLKNYSVFEGREALAKILDVDGGNVAVRWRLFLASFGAINEDCVKYCVKYLKKEKLKQFAEFLSYVPENDRKQYIDILAKSVVSAIKYCDVKDRYNDEGYRNYVINTLRSTSNKKLPLESPRAKMGKFKEEKLSKKELFKLKDKIMELQYNTNNIDDNIPKDEKLFVEIKFSTLTDRFNEVVKFYGDNEQDGLIESLYLMAKAFHKIKEFDMAKKYYNLIVMERNSEHKAYWQMLLCDIKCVDNIELTNTTYNLGEYENFNRAVQTAGVYDEQYVEKYLIIRKEQENNRGSILKSRKKKLIKNWVIAIGAVLFQIAIIILILYHSIWKVVPISNFSDLYKIRDNPNKSYYLTNDINLSGVNWMPIPNFTGKLDGRGYSIYNLTIENRYVSNIGLFAQANDAEFVDITINNVSISLEDSNNPGVGNIGVLAGYMSNCTMTDIYVEGTINTPHKSYVGGVVGYYATSKDKYLGECKGINNYVKVFGKEYVGGIFGYCESNFDLVDSSNNAYIKGKNNVGGIAGYYCNGIKDKVTLEVNEVANRASVEGVGNNIGGLFGCLYDTNLHLCSCTNYPSLMGTISQNKIWGNMNVGGLVGYMENGAFTNSSVYVKLVNSSTDTRGKYFGGFVGTYQNKSGKTITISQNSDNRDSSTSTNLNVDYYGSLIGKIYIDNELKILEHDNLNYINEPDVMYVGLVAGIVEGGGKLDIQNIKLKSITGKECVGGLIGISKLNAPIFIDNVNASSGPVIKSMQNYAGLIIGSAELTNNYTSTINNVYCYSYDYNHLKVYNTWRVIGKAGVGGIIGSATGTGHLNITNCDLHCDSTNTSELIYDSESGQWISNHALYGVSGERSVGGILGYVDSYIYVRVYNVRIFNIRASVSEIEAGQLIGVAGDGEHIGYYDCVDFDITYSGCKINDLIGMVDTSN